MGGRHSIGPWRFRYGKSDLGQRQKESGYGRTERAVSEGTETAVGLRSLPRRQVRVTFIGVLVAMFLSSLDQTVVGTAMPRIICDLGGFSHYTWVATSYMVASAVAIPITGKLIDLYGRKKFYLSGLIVFVLASLLCGLSNSMLQIIIFRGVQGIGAGIMMANAFTVVGDLFPPAERGKYQGFTSGTFGLSAIIGPTLGGYVTDVLSWHWVFFINIPLGIALIIIFVFFFPGLRPDASKHRVDYPGLATLVLTVIPLMLALAWGGAEYPWNSLPVVGMLVFSALMLGVFLRIESRSEEPIIPLSLFQDRIVAISQLVIFLTGIGMFSAIAFIPLFFQGVLGTTATVSGNFLTPMMLGMVAGSIISGQFLSRAGGHYRIQGAIGIAIMGAGLALLSRMTTETSYASAVVRIIVTGFGLGITLPLYTIAVQNAVPYRLLGVATSSTAFFRSVGTAVGLGALGSVMNDRLTADFVQRASPLVGNGVPRDIVTSLAHNPQLLVGPEVQQQWQNLLAQLDSQGMAVYGQLSQALRQALNSALSHVFLISVFILVFAFVANLFIKEIPLRRQHNTGDSGTLPAPE